MLKKILLLLAVQFVGVGLCAWVAWPHLQSQATERAHDSAHLSLGVHEPDATTALQTATLGIPDDLLAKAQGALQTQTLTLSANHWTRTLDLAALGARLVAHDDVAQHRVLAAQGYAFIPTTLSWQSADADAEPHTQDVFVGMHTDTARRALDGFRRRVNRRPIAARWDFGSKQVIGERDGATLDVEATVNALHTALVDAINQRLPNASLAAVIVPQPAAVGRTELANFVPEHRLGSFSTPYKARHVDRVINLRLAANAIDGVILGPGETFSYNEVVGERTAARGYKEAPVIVNGEVVEGMGGGACQISSTLHAAGLFAGVEIIERYNHTLPSDYIRVGLDAVVAWPNLDLRLSNPYPFPVAFRIALRDERVRADVWGSNPGNRVRLRREVYEEVPYDDDVFVNDEMEYGHWNVRRPGRVGYRVRKGRIVWKDGKETYEQLGVDSYRSQNAEIHIGPGTTYPPVDGASYVPPDDDDEE